MGLATACLDFSSQSGILFGRWRRVAAEEVDLLLVLSFRRVEQRRRAPKIHAATPPAMGGDRKYAGTFRAIDLRSVAKDRHQLWRMVGGSGPQKIVIDWKIISRTRATAKGFFRQVIEATRASRDRDFRQRQAIDFPGAKLARERFSRAGAHRQLVGTAQQSAVERCRCTRRGACKGGPSTGLSS